ncbi:MAG: NUDIX hydrolase [Parvularculaceae bacterium]
MSSDKTIGVGVGAVVFRGDEVLLIRRGKAPFLGQWSIPGGGLHYGETIEAATIREVLEETGVEIRLGELLGVFEALPAETGGHVVMIDHAAEWLAGEPVAGDDAAAAEFVGLEEALRRVSWDKTRQAIAKAAELRNRAANRL